MMAMEWLGLLFLAALLAVVGIALRGGRLERMQGRRFMCPLLHEPVGCRIHQNIRTGQWLRVETCSHFGDPEEVTCGQECIRLMNLGFRLPDARSV
jgi:rRNA processing protein Krr1/Pno1